MRKIIYLSLPFLYFSIALEYSYNHTQNAYHFSDSLITDTLIKKDMVTQEELNKGKTLYEKTCNRCHTLYEPADFTLSVWKKNLKEMRVKASLSQYEYKQILSYLSHYCKKD